MKKLIVVFLILLPGLLFCKQWKIDVKTKFADKKELMIVKSGVIAFLNNAPYCKVCEIGEDFALWLRNYNVNFYDDHFIYSVLMEIRKPSFIGEGQLIGNVTIQDTMPNELLDANNIENKQQLDMIYQQIGKSSSIAKRGFGSVAALATSFLDGGLIAGTILTNLGRTAGNNKYKVSDVSISYLIGKRVEAILKKYCSNLQIEMDKKSKK